uniref:Uncharacterized protein n=1 Tax=Oncorhynchus tshawytscha TaxID=74940 RepID=A0A8C8CFL2_ONCTS
MSESNSKAANELTEMMEATMQDLHNKFQIISDQIVSKKYPFNHTLLLKNVADLMTQAGLEEQQTSK